MKSASIRQIIKAVGGSNIAIKKHFYYVSGFFDMVFSFREVKDRKDFTGGKNLDFNQLARGAGFKVKMPSFKPQA